MSNLDLHTSLGQTIYLAAEDRVDELVTELGEVSAVDGRLVFAPGPARPAAWAQNIWHDPVRIPIASIKDGARALRGIQRNWALFSQRHHRRASLIEENLPHVSAKPVTFPSAVPTAALGSWTLLEEGVIVASARCSSHYRNGEVQFVEDKTTPPNRAYLKLWEAITLFGEKPGPKDRCLDLGACPGGWSWVLHELGADVISVDKAPLDPKIAALPRIEFRQESAFGLAPADIGRVDWLCCDIICYPTRLLRLVNQWRESGLAKHFICTLKFQAETDHEAARAFAAIPGSRLMHLHHNKHELTWMWTAP